MDELQIIEETTQYVDKKYPKHMTKGKGVKTLYGHEYQLKVTPNYGVTYPRERDETNPLYNIVKKFPNLVRDGYCKLEPKESGSQVEKLLDSDEEHTKWLQEAIQEIKTFRVKKPIKPKIEVK